MGTRVQDKAFRALARMRLDNSNMGLGFRKTLVLAPGEVPDMRDVTLVPARIVDWEIGRRKRGTLPAVASLLSRDASRNVNKPDIADTKPVARLRFTLASRPC